MYMRSIQESNPRLFRQVLGHFATGVTVITTVHEGCVHGMTANAFCSVSLEPPLVLVSVDNRSHMYRLLRQSGRYSVSVLARGQEMLSRHFAGRPQEGLQLPFELAGYWVVCTVLAATAPRLFRVLFWVMAYAILIGTVFHGTFLSVILVGQAAHRVVGAAQASLLQLQTTLLVFSTPLVGFFGVCYFVMWSIVVFTVLRTATRYPKWIVLFVPALGSLLITGVYESHVVPVLANLLYPAVLSLPHLVFFLLSTGVLWRSPTYGQGGEA